MELIYSVEREEWEREREDISLQAIATETFKTNLVKQKNNN